MYDGFWPGVRGRQRRLWNILLHRTSVWLTGGFVETLQRHVNCRGIDNDEDIYEAGGREDTRWMTRLCSMRSRIYESPSFRAAVSALKPTHPQ